MTDQGIYALVYDPVPAARLPRPRREALVQRRDDGRGFGGAEYKRWTFG
jgi:hypothetical protein